MITTNENHNFLDITLNEAVCSIREMTSDRKFHVDEWKAFFSQDGIIEIISQERFLRELGACFATKGVNDNLFQILMAQLSRINSYLRSQHTNLTSSTGSNPLSYAEFQINAAHERYKKKKKKLLEIGCILLAAIYFILFRID